MEEIEKRNGYRRDMRKELKRIVYIGELEDSVGIGGILLAEMCILNECY